MSPGFVAGMAAGGWGVLLIQALARRLRERRRRAQEKCEGCGCSEQQALGSTCGWASQTDAKGKKHYWCGRCAPAHILWRMRDYGGPGAEV